MNRPFPKSTSWAIIGLFCAASAFAKPAPGVVDDALVWAETDPGKAIVLLEEALAHDEVPRNSRPIVMIHAGEQHRLAGHPDKARRWFTDAAEQAKGSDLAAAHMGMALVDATGDPEPAVWVVLRDANGKDLLESQDADRYLLLAIRAAQHERPELKNLVRKAIDTAPTSVQRARIESVLARLAEAPQSVQTADFTELTAPADPIEQAREALAAGDLETARSMAERATESEDEQHRAVAAYMIQKIDAGAVSDPKKIGVLLPLSGKYEAVGRQVSQALEHGFAGAEMHRTLVYADSGGTPETAVAALDKLVIEQGVIAVVGPLLSGETEQVTAAATALEVPLISLSQALENPEESSWVFQSMLTTRHQIEALVEYAMNEANAKKFGVFAPDSEFGIRSAELFRQSVERHGGEVTVVHQYVADSTDLIDDARALGRKDYDARRSEFQELRRSAESAGRDPSKVVLPPIIDYDALFLPERAARVPIVCAALAFEEFPVGEFAPIRDGDTIPLMGLSGWNNDSLVTGGGPYVRGGFFTDAFLLPSEAWPNAEATTFVEAYKDATRRTPTSLEALTVDTGRLLAVAARSDAVDRAGFRQALRDATLDTAVTGARGFHDESGDIEREVRVFSITRDGIVEAPRTAPLQTDPTPAGGLGQE